jgi:hypothetical protein
MIPALPRQMGLAGNRRCDPVSLHSSQTHETKLINEVTCYFGQKWWFSSDSFKPVLQNTVILWTPNWTIGPVQPLTWTFKPDLGPVLPGSGSNYCLWTWSMPPHSTADHHPPSAMMDGASIPTTRAKGVGPREAAKKITSKWNTNKWSYRSDLLLVLCYSEPKATS